MGEQIEGPVAYCDRAFVLSAGCCCRLGGNNPAILLWLGLQRQCRGRDLAEAA